MTLVIERDFAKRNEGQISNIRLECNVSSIILDGKTLPESSVEYLLHFALQSLQDAYAGAKNLDEAKSLFAKKYDKIIAGTVGIRETNGETVSDETRIARKLVRAQFRNDKALWTKFTALSDEDQIAALDRNIAKNSAALKPAIDMEIAELKRKKAAQSAMSGAISIEL